MDEGSFEVSRLGRLARTISGVGFPPDEQGMTEGDLPFLKVSDLADPRNAAGIVTATNWVSRGQARRLGVRPVPPGSIVFPKVGAALLGNARALTRVECALDNNMMAVAPVAGEPRYWLYVLRTVDMGILNLSGTLPFISDSAVRDLDLHLSREIDEQRRIADFLDDQVARIDNIIAARKRQIGAVQADLDSEWNDEAVHLEPLVPLRRFLRSIVDGPFGSSLTSAHYRDDGVRVIRLGNIGLAAFRGTDKAYIAEDHARDLAQHSVVAGDLLMAGLGDDRWPLGRCTVAPTHLGRAIVKADCYRIRLAVELTAPFVAWYLSSPVARSRFTELARGSTRARLNTQLAREALVPAVSLMLQQSVVTRFEAASSRTSQATGVLQRSVDVLNELKRSLITAAVTGEFDVSSADGSRVLV
jgi:type I restriction enzyme S subunit